ncbi:unnamed protein product [Chrysoparadoxa australica]
MSTSITVLWQGKRKPFKVGGNTLMSSVLNDACTSFGLQAGSCCLMHKKNQKMIAVDLSQPFRYTGIPQNATIELKEIVKIAGKGKVEVGLRLPGVGERILGTFTSSHTLSEVLQQFVDRGSIPEAVLHGNPSLNFMRQAYSGPALSSTLESIGLCSGSAMLALTWTSGLSPTTVPAAALAAPLVATPIPAPTPAAPTPSLVVPPALVPGSTSPPALAPPASTPTPTPMDESEPAPAPAVGLEGCKQALELMKTRHFDSDSSEGVLILIKYIDNIVHRPEEPRTRRIRCSNAAFKQKVGRLQGGTEFLRCLGFRPVVSGLSHEIAKDPENHTELVLSTALEDTTLLQSARSMLKEEAEMMGIPSDRIPRPPAPKRAPPAAQQAFDPFKPMMTSTAPIPKPTGPSATNQKLDELLAKRERIEGGNLADRAVKVTLPGQGGENGSRSGTGSLGSTAAMSKDGQRGELGDQALIAQRVARLQAERKKKEEVPFQTKAMRDVERLSKAKAYAHTLIRVQLPDRVVIQAKFMPRESIAAVTDMIRGCLQEQAASLSFHLYISPPKEKLTVKQILAEKGLVPAALMYLSWDSVAPQGPATYLKPDLLQGDAPNSASAADTAAGASSTLYPTGMELVEGARKEGNRGSTASGKGPSSRSGSSSASSSKSGKKPGWLKL